MHLHYSPHSGPRDLKLTQAFRLGSAVLIISLKGGRFEGKYGDRSDFIEGVKSFCYSRKKRYKGDLQQLTFHSSYSSFSVSVSIEAVGSISSSHRSRTSSLSVRP